MNTATPGSRSVTETLELVRRVVWALFAAFVAGLLALAAAGFVLAASEPLPLVALLGAAVAGALLAGVADVLFE